MDYRNEMKIQFLVNSEEQRILRKQEVRSRNKQRKAKARQVNHNFHDINRVNLYAERMLLRREQRYLHLARAFWQGTPYRSVEQTTREGNEPNLDRLVNAIEHWGDIAHLTPYVEMWLEAVDDNTQAA